MRRVLVPVIFGIQGIGRVMALLKNFQDFRTGKLLLPGLTSRKQGESLHRRTTDVAPTWHSLAEIHV